MTCLTTKDRADRNETDLIVYNYRGGKASTEVVERNSVEDVILIETLSIKPIVELLSDIC